MGVSHPLRGCLLRAACAGKRNVLGKTNMDHKSVKELRNDDDIMHTNVFFAYISVTYSDDIQSQRLSIHVKVGAGATGRTRTGAR